MQDEEAPGVFVPGGLVVEVRSWAACDIKFSAGEGPVWRFSVRFLGVARS